ncbi:uncharacterized protein [Diadema antillarum]|uniref:uncharacterized protein n=1 Tax=Diadema antillarum TaxID=105358 RepID=UPI003A8424A7
MPFLKWGVREKTFSSIPTSEQGCTLPVLATKKQLTRPYGPEHLKATVERVKSHYSGDGTRVMGEPSATYEKPLGKLAPEIVSGKAGGCEEFMHPSDIKAVRDDRSCTEPKDESQGDDQTSVRSEKLDREVDLDRLSETEIYQRVPRLRANRFEHGAFSGRTAPPLVQSTKRFYGSAPVLRLGKAGRDNLKVTGQTMDLTSKAVKNQSSDLEASDDFDLSNNLHKRTNQSRASTTGVSECTGPKADEADPQRERDGCSGLSLDDNDGRQKEDGSESDRCQRNSSCRSVRPELSPARVQMDPSNLPRVSPRSRPITGTRMRFEVATPVICKSAETRSAGEIEDINFNRHIAAVASAQDVIDYRPTRAEREREALPSVRLLAWHPALHDVLHSESVSLRPRSEEGLYIKPTSPAKFATHAHHFPEIPSTLQDAPITSSVSYRGKRLQIKVDMRSLRLPPIFSYNHPTQSIGLHAKTDWVGCVGGY